MIGQTRLLEHIYKYTVDTFPTASLIVGEHGMGKHTLAKLISDNILKLPLVDLTETLNAETLNEIYKRVLPAVYLIDLTTIVDKQQNILLKFIEEPPPGAFVLLLTEYENRVLNTVQSRCVIFTLQPYSQDELKMFLPENCPEDFINILRSPGRIKAANINLLKATADYAEKIATRLADATYANTLSIVSKVNFKDNYDKFDLDTLLDMLANSLFKHYLSSSNIKIYNLYECLIEHKKTLLDARINREIFLENLLTDLWLLVRK